MKNSYEFYSLSPTYRGENKDTYKGVPCKISINKKSENEYLIYIDKIISDSPVLYKKSLTNFRIEDEGNLWVVYFEESADMGSKYSLTVSYNGYPISLTYCPNKLHKDVLITYNSPIFYWTNWANFKPFENIDDLSQKEYSEIIEYCDTIVKLSRDVETAEFFNVMIAYVRHYQKEVFVKELNNSLLIKKAIEELDSYFMTCIADINNYHRELLEQQMDGGIFSDSVFKKGFINARKQLNYLSALKSVLHSISFDIENGVEKENKEMTNKIFREQEQTENNVKRPVENTFNTKEDKPKSGCLGVIVGLLILIGVFFLKMM